MGSILIDDLPKHIIVDDKEYPINSDFRTSIQYELLQQERGINDEEKFLLTLHIYLPELPDNIEAAITEIIKFYSYSRHEELLTNTSGTEKPSSPIYSYEFDDGYIYAAFLQCYGIDLIDIDYLHWWKFQAMFASLPEDCEINKIMGYRGIKLTDKMSKEQKKFYRKMKQIYKLPDMRTQEEKEADFLSAIGSVI